MRKLLGRILLSTLALPAFPRTRFVETHLFVFIFVTGVGAFLAANGAEQLVLRSTWSSPPVWPIVLDGIAAHLFLIGQAIGLGVMLDIRKRTTRHTRLILILAVVLVISLYLVGRIYKAGFGYSRPNLDDQASVAPLREPPLHALIRSWCIVGTCPFMEWNDDSMPSGTATRQTALLLFLVFLVNGFLPSIPRAVRDHALPWFLIADVLSIAHTIIARSWLGFHTVLEGVIGIAVGYLIF
jgi:hypothetical protein